MESVSSFGKVLKLTSTLEKYLKYKINADKLSISVYIYSSNFKIVTWLTHYNMPNSSSRLHLGDRE